MDYWIHLNKSIDAADECLRRQRRLVEDPSAEVVMMFINHCPTKSCFIISIEGCRGVDRS